jgi:uncharacterized protein YeaO (DUF488 family)
MKCAASSRVAPWTSVNSPGDMRLKIKRVYDDPAEEDGFRVLVDRLWPRGLKKEDARLGLWLRDIAPSDELRRWYRHDETLWPEFRKRYFAELDAMPDVVEQLRKAIGGRNATLLYSTRHTDHNNARALLEYLTRQRAAADSVEFDRPQSPARSQ